jgi:hypothetical protein
VRARMADTSEHSDFNSAQQHVKEYVDDGSRELEVEPNEPRLGQLVAPTSHSIQKITCSGWTGRAEQSGMTNALRYPPACRPSFSSRVRVRVRRNLEHVRRGGREYQVAVLGSVGRLREAADRLGRRFLKGLGQSRRLYLREA